MMSAQFARYVVVGGVNTALAYLVYALLLWLGLAFQWANLGAAIAGIAISFSTQSRFVFANKKLGKIVPYALLWGGMYLLNIALIWAFKQTGLGDYLAGLVAMPPVILLSFLLQKTLIFRPVQPS